MYVLPVIDYSIWSILLRRCNYSTRKRSILLLCYDGYYRCATENWPSSDFLFIYFCDDFSWKLSWRALGVHQMFCSHFNGFIHSAIIDSYDKIRENRRNSPHRSIDKALPSQSVPLLFFSVGKYTSIENDECTSKGSVRSVVCCVWSIIDYISLLDVVHVEYNTEGNNATSCESVRLSYICW
jgi:hypothetical protein